MDSKALLYLFAEFIEQGGVAGHSEGYIDLGGKNFEFDISPMGFKLTEIPDKDEFNPKA